MLHLFVASLAYLSAVICPMEWAQQIKTEPPYAHVIEADGCQYYNVYDKESNMFAWTLYYEEVDENDDMGL